MRNETRETEIRRLTAQAEAVLVAVSGAGFAPDCGLRDVRTLAEAGYRLLAAARDLLHADGRTRGAVRELANGVCGQVAELQSAAALEADRLRKEEQGG